MLLRSALLCLGGLQASLRVHLELVDIDLHIKKGHSKTS